MEDYTKAIYALETREDSTAVTTNALAERLGVLGLVAHQPYHGVQLTPAGHKVALEVLRHHRLL